MAVPGPTRKPAPSCKCTSLGSGTNLSCRAATRVCAEQREAKRLAPKTRPEKTENTVFGIIHLSGILRFLLPPAPHPEIVIARASAAFIFQTLPCLQRSA